MCKRLAVACLFALMPIALLGCGAKENAPETADNSDAATQPDSASPYQYMAVCTSKEAHEGHEYVLTKWLDSKYQAEVYGQEHSRKKKGHEVVYRERAKP